MTRRCWIHSRRTTRCTSAVRSELYTRYRFRYRQNISFGFVAEKDEGEQFFKGAQRTRFRLLQRASVPPWHRPTEGLGLGRLPSAIRTRPHVLERLGLRLQEQFQHERETQRHRAYTVYEREREPVPARRCGHLFTHEKVGGHGLRFQQAHRCQREHVLDQRGQPWQQLGERSTCQQLSGGWLPPHEQGTGEEGRLGRAASSAVTCAMPIADTALVLRWHMWNTPATSHRTTATYRQFVFNGKENTTAGVDWNVLYRNLTWFGEVATSANGGTAMNTGLLLSLDKRVSMSLLLPQLRPRLPGPVRVSFGETIDPWNEQGLVHRHRDPSEPTMDHQRVLRSVPLSVVALPDRCTVRRFRLARTSELETEQEDGDVRAGQAPGQGEQHHR